MKTPLFFVVGSALATVFCAAQTPSLKTYGIDFSPYENGQNPNLGSVVTRAEILSRMQVIAPYTTWVRSFSSTSGNENMPGVARQLGLKVAANAWISSNTAQNAMEISNLIAAANSGQIDVAIVGSEAILRNDVSVSQLIAYMTQVRQAIPSSIPVTTADVWGTFIANPSLIAASDLVFVNFYPYWEGTSINNAVCSLEAEYQRLVSAAGAKQIVISETGWPSAGNAFGAAVPSVANANLYALQFMTWANTNNIPSFYFEAFNEDWKVSSEGPQGANWGIWDENAVIKPGMDSFFNGGTASLACNGILNGPVGVSPVYVPPYGSTDQLEVQVGGVQPASYALASYIKVGVGWWTKPTFANPTVSINSDGSARIPIVTGGSDQDATEILVFLIPAGTTPPAVGGGAKPTIPSAVASFDVLRTASSISGTITDNHSNPIAGAVISDPVLGSTTSAPDGKYSFYNISTTGTAVLTVTYPNYSFATSPASVTINSGNQIVNFTGVEAVDLAVAASLSQTTVALDASASLTAVASNAGPGPAADATATLAIPGAFTLTSVATTRGACITNAQTVTCDLGALAATASATITVNVIASNSSGTFNFMETVSGPDPDPNLANNSASQAVMVLNSTPSYSLSSTTLTFPNQPVGTSSAKQSVTLTSTGNAAVLISSITLNGAGAADFSLLTTATSCSYSGASVAVGGSCTIDLVFTPESSGAFSATVSIQSNVLNPPSSIAVSGAGTSGASSATYSGLDTTAQGTWTGHYGRDGGMIANGLNQIPSYASVAFSGDSLYTWSGSTSDGRALQTATGSSTRIASTHYSTTGFTIAMNLTDGQPHRVALYLLDWDTAARAETITIRDSGTNALLDTETFANFHNGEYAIWNIRGGVTIQVTATAGYNGVVSGIFFDTSAALTATSIATFGGVDTTPQGTWTGHYGNDGGLIANGLNQVPAYASVSLLGNSVYIWNASTSDVRALQTSTGAATRIASTYYSNSSFTMNVNMTDGNTHRVALYLLDWDTSSRAETITIRDARTNAVLDTETFSSFHNGQYAVWNMKGNVIVQVTGTAGYNGVVSGVFFDPPAGSLTTATYAGLDTTAQGTWTGHYGNDGGIIANGLNQAPTYAAVSFSGDSLYTWNGTTSDTRGLQTAAGSSTRIASTYYSGNSFTIDVNFSDGRPHQVSLYLVDWDTSSRAETISIRDAVTNSLLDTETFANFHNGQYAVWNIQGNVTIQVTGTAGYNGVVSGVFFDTSEAITTTSVATYGGVDTAPQGTWTGHYGNDGGLIANGLNQVPSYATVGLFGNSVYIWNSSTSDVRALQTSMGASNRIASTYYSTGSFTMNVNLTDGNTHRIAFYLLDWDTTARAETITIRDARTNALLDTESFSNFHDGEYAIWNIKGNVLIQVTGTAGYNGVVSGVFFN